MSILDQPVSIYPNYFDATTGKEVSLLRFLTTAPARHVEKVQAIRATQDKAERDRLKAQLPAITPSGLFSSRKASGLIRHSGFIQIDIDGKDHEHVANFGELKEMFCRLPQIAYFGLSVSGRGYWGLIPIADPASHAWHFRALQRDLGRHGVMIDRSCIDVCRLRGYSYDPAAYFNHSAKTYANILKPEPERPARYAGASGSEAGRVEACLKQIEARRVDIAPNYAEWFGMAAALASEFGEAGRGYFHRASQFYPRYSSREADRQFDACLKGRRGGYTIGTFYELCKRAGVRFSDCTTPTESPGAHERPTAGTEQAQGQESAHSAPQQAQGLPGGFALVGEVLEVDGLPWEWLNEEEQADARARIAGHELEVFTAINPHVGELITRLGLEVEAD